MSQDGYNDGRDIRYLLGDQIVLSSASILQQGSLLSFPPKNVQSQFEASFDSVGCGSSRSKAVGAFVPRGLGDGFESQQVECLHGSVIHRRDTQGSQLTRALGDIYSSQRLSLIASLPQGVYGGHLLVWRRPGYPIDAGCSLP